MIRLLTAEEFLAAKSGLPEAGRWHELVAGEILDLEPPPTVHSTVVLNFSKSLAEYLESTREGYAYFELGLLVSRAPDTIRFPAISYFTGDGRFAESDKQVTDTVPSLVLDIVSTPARRQGVSARIDEYLAWGVEQVWIVDPKSEEAAIHTGVRECCLVAKDDRLHGELVESGESLSGFSVRLAELFREPDWWRR